MRSKNWDFLRNKWKDICFSTLNSYSFDKVDKKLFKVASSIKKSNFEGKDFVSKYLKIRTEFMRENLIVMTQLVLRPVFYTVI